MMFVFLHNHNHWPGTAVEQRGDLWIWSHESFNDSLYQFQAGGELCLDRWKMILVKVTAVQPSFLG